MAIPVNQIIRSQRKTLAIIVKPDGSVIVRAPLRISEKRIWEFVEKNRPWIERKRAKALAIPAQPAKQYRPGEEFLFLGTTYPLEIVDGQEQDLRLDQTFKLAESAQGRAASLFQAWYREQARQILEGRVQFYARQYHLQYKRIGITSARTRWGSCSATGSLNFSWRLVLAPLEVIDYVVVHELAHTVFHNHSRQFWQQVEKFMPDYKKHRAWLREHGQHLI